MPTIKALDVSSHSGSIVLGKWEAARADGWELAVVQAWGGLPGGGSGPNPHARDQLSGARAAGLQTAIYIWIPPDTDPHTHELIRLAKEAAGGEYQHTLFTALDIEDERRRPLHPDDPGGRLMDAIDNLDGDVVVIYTSISMWADVMRGSTDFCDFPLWDARWSPTIGLDDAWVPYGGWTRCAMRQHAGTTQIHGITADLNVVDLARLGIEPCPDQDLQEEVDRLRRQNADIKHTVAQSATLLETITDTLKELSERQ